MRKKGQIFVLDIMLAIVVVALLIGASVYFFSKSDEDFLNNLQMVKTGGDIVAVLEEEGDLDTLSQSIIQTRIEELLPVNYAMRLSINTTLYPVPIIVETEQQADDQSFIAAGKRFFVFEKDNVIHNGAIRYEVWLR